MKKILIIGAGFAGLSALSKLAPAKDALEITLVDKKQEFNFLPMLPDIIGRGIAPEFLNNHIGRLCAKSGAKFIQDEIIAIDLQKQAASTRTRTLNYDYLVVACGSQTNFYGQEQIAQQALKLDNVPEAEKILLRIKDGRDDNFIIAGGGYTGIEVASNLRLLFNKLHRDKKIMIVELTASLLGPLPDWMKDYVAANLKRLNIEVLLETKIQKIEQDKVSLSNGQDFTRAMLIWTAGVKSADFIFNLDLEKTRQGRIKVDDFLRFKDGCFAVGDAAEFTAQNKPLRMAVQFSIAEGETAALNILRDIRHKPLKKFRPKDLGYVIPMANNQSCGNILGINMKGHFPTILHYLMCIYRSFSLKNKFGIINDLLLKK